MKPFLLVLLLLPFLPLRAEPIAPELERIAFAGDSITQMRQYTIQFETYLRFCSGFDGGDVLMFGWGGETTLNFATRMARDVAPRKPTSLVVVYGMNDGRYKAFDELNAKNYSDGLRKILAFFPPPGTRVWIASPQAVDPDIFNQGTREQGVVYNETLRRFGEIGQKLAAENGAKFVDINAVMREVLPKAKAKYGPKFKIFGNDGIHSSRAGHFLMAYACLRAMNIGRPIGTFTHDYATGTTETTDGHRVIASKTGVMELESSRYPYCFNPAEGEDPRNPATLLDMFGFQSEMNSMLLRVRNFPAESGIVSWGAAKKTFSRAALEKGVDLALEFTENPFSEKFRAVQTAVAAKQNLDFTLFKDLQMWRMNMEKEFKIPDTENLLAPLRAALETRREAMKAELAKLRVPLRHVIRLDPAPSR